MVAKPRKITTQLIQLRAITKFACLISTKESNTIFNAILLLRLALPEKKAPGGLYSLLCSLCIGFSLTRSSYPTYTSVLLRAIEWWYHDPNVSTPVLKLMAELVQNRSQRLHFDVSSPNGILLFRVTSQMIVAYGMTNRKTCY